MMPDQSRALFQRLCAPWPPPSKELAEVYGERLAKLDYTTARIAVDRLLEKHDGARMPTPARFRQEYDLTAADMRQSKGGSKADPPMSPTELRAAAEELAAEVVRRVTQNGMDPMTAFLQELSDTYAKNAELRSAGRPVLSLPKVSAVMQAMQEQSRQRLRPAEKPAPMAPTMDPATAAMACRLCGDPYGEHAMLKRDFLAVRCGDVAVRL